MPMVNPFPVIKYKGPKHFCDREEETKEIISALKNGRNITIYSIRRLGKTGLIHHVFHKLKRSKQFVTIYLDIYDTQTDGEFVNIVCSSVFKTLSKDNETMIKQVTKFFGKYRPSISFDQITGNPSIQLDIKTAAEVKLSLDTIMNYIGSQKKTVVLAFDEFQQIKNYPNSKIAATLRKYLQQVPNFQAIFSGSQRNLLVDMFASPKQELFRTTQMLPLDKIKHEEYREYILFHFKQGLKSIGSGLIDEILDWTRCHTYYTQYFAHRLYESANKTVKLQDIEELKYQLLKENEPIFQSYRQLLSKQQWKLLKSIGQDQRVIGPTSKDFIAKHDLGSHSTVRLSLSYLTDKEMIYSEHDEGFDKPAYIVYDVFLARWLENRT